MINYIIFIMLLICPSLGWAGVDQGPKKFSTLASEDFAVYKSSSFAHPSWDAYVKEGFEAFDRQDAESTVTILKKAANMGCLSPLVTMKMALGYEALKIYYPAVQYYELAREQFKNHHKGHRYNRDFNANYGRALYMMGKVDEAVAVLEQSTQEIAGHPWVYKLLGEHYVAQNKIAEAVNVYTKLLETPDHGLTPQEVYNLNLQVARVYANQDNKELAKKYYQKVLQMDPADIEAKRYVSTLEPATPRQKGTRYNFPSLGNDTIDKVFEVLNNQ